PRRTPFPYTTLFRSPDVPNRPLPIANTQDPPQIPDPLFAPKAVVSLSNTRTPGDYFVNPDHYSVEIYAFSCQEAETLTIYRHIRSEEHTSELQSREN